MNTFHIIRHVVVCFVLFSCFSGAIVAANDAPPLPDTYAEAVLHVEGMI